ncbi:MAG: hypothetical protein R3335_07255 [Anaerolineales bacterium]|nr:hypothetical protein [Anaerolineales bacterium]
MRHFRRLPILLLTFVVIYAVLAVTASAPAPQTAVAQEGDGPENPENPAGPGATSAEQSQVELSPQDGLPWTSSAELEEGSQYVIMSPPDGPSKSGPQADAAEGGLTSWRVIGSALRPRENDVSYTINGSGSCSYVTAGDASTVWNTPINLPQGSTVDTLRMYYYDTSASNTTAWFTIYDLYGSIVDEWSVSSSTSGGNSFNDSPQINHVIDYSVYSYLLNWRPIVTGSTLQLCGFRLFYEPPPFGSSFLPSISK